jgi:lysophospholipase L1-like esterase
LRARRLIVQILSILIITLVMLDAFLYHLDPLGVVAARHAQATFFTLMELHPTGYRLRTGTHRLHNYTMTITEEGYRAVPDNAGAGCTIAAIGDSVTMGIGVDDSDTWVNLLAQALPDVYWINAGRSDYSVGNVLALLQNTPADGYLWVILGNDVITPFDGVPVLAQNINIYLPATRLYIEYVRSLSQTSVRYEGQPGRPVAMEQYWDSADQLLTTPNVLGFAFADDDTGMDTASRYDNVRIIPPFTARLSPADSHPSIEGHRQIANAMLPYVREFAASICANR